MRIQWFYFSNMSSALFVKFFRQKSQETLNVGKIRNYDEERQLFREKKFSFFKNFLYKNGKAQNMPVITGRLVLNTVKQTCISEIFLKFKQPGLKSKT